MNKNKSIYLTDNPNNEQDSFQIHTNIADTIYDIITKHDVSKNSFTIGLFGQWGSGKSFIINKISERIKEKNKANNITYLYIDIWKYSGFPLLRSILFDLNKQFSNLYDIDSEKYDSFRKGYAKNGHSLESLLKYSKRSNEEVMLTPKESWGKIFNSLKKYRIIWIILILFLFLFFILPICITDLTNNNIYRNFSPFIDALKSFISFTGIGTVILFLFKKPIEELGSLVFFKNVVREYTEKPNFSPEQFEEIFKDMLRKIEKEKYVIVFDNLDRCEPSVAYETLSTIKTFMDVENCFYIIPADDNAIKNYLSNYSINQGEIEKDKGISSLFERKFTEEFIDKIFQTYIRIPPLKEVERDEYIKEQLIKIDFQDKLFDKDIETITQILYYAYKGESPRNIIRFVNDYSTYFQLALKSLPRLLDNITLFTIMIAIKQKWYDFEKILLNNPDFFNRYPTNKNLLDEIDSGIKDDLLFFLNSIQSFYIPQIKGLSFNEYIFFKESEEGLTIAKALRSIEPEAIKINDENIKILNSEFRKVVKNKEQFSVNGFITFAYLIINNKDHKLYNKIVIEFWIRFIELSHIQLEHILKKLFEEKVLNRIIDSSNIEDLQNHKINIEEKFVKYFEHISRNYKNSKLEEYKNVFKTIITSNYAFNINSINRLFSSWNKDNLLLNSFINIISTEGKIEYLPIEVLNKLVDSPIGDKSLEVLNNWDRNTIPAKTGCKLSKALILRIQDMISSNNYHNTPKNIMSIEQDLQIISLINISFIETSKFGEFVTTISNLIKNIFRFVPGQNRPHELAIKLWVETAYFSTKNRDLVDRELFEIFEKYIMKKPGFLCILINNLSYSKNILSLPKTKESIFKISPKLQVKLYEGLEKKDFSNYNLVLIEKYESLIVFFEFIKEHNIEVNGDTISKYILEKLIKLLIEEKISILKELVYLREKFDLKQHKDLIIKNKNGIVDYYKNKSSNAFEILKEFKQILTYSEFFTTILKPIISFINSELKKGEEVSCYSIISELIEPTNNKKNIDLLYSVAKKCLEKNQSVEENKLGLVIIDKIFNNITEKQKHNIKEAINNNDNYNNWETEIIESLINIGVISD